MDDPFDLDRFLNAQASVYGQVLTELRAGQKRSHWIWFIFPQMKGLGSSSHAHFYGIGSLEEAAAYWRHPVLGSRLEECTRLVNEVEKRTSMTLFSHASEGADVFTQALDKYFDSRPDELTLELLR